MRTRQVPLAGAVNFRDLGGYEAVDGRAVRWGLLHRADSLAELTDSDLAAVQALGLRSVFDLRHASEREQRPSRHHPDAQHHTHAIGFFPHGSEALMAGVRSRQLSAEEAQCLLLAMYRRFPVDHAATYAGLLQALLAPEALPALIHCTSGKDRTGFGVAVLLMALGVPRETIVDDYLLTNQYRRDLSFMLGHDVDPEVMAVVKAADPAFLLAAFGVIDAAWGGTEGFLRQGLGLSAADQARLQDLLLCTPT